MLRNWTQTRINYNLIKLIEYIESSKNSFIRSNAKHDWRSRDNGKLNGRRKNAIIISFVMQMVNESEDEVANRVNKKYISEEQWVKTEILIYKSTI